jgi:hypothetical protein
MFDDVTFLNDGIMFLSPPVPQCWCHISLGWHHVPMWERPWVQWECEVPMCCQIGSGGPIGPRPHGHLLDKGGTQVVHECHFACAMSSPCHIVHTLTPHHHHHHQCAMSASQPITSSPCHHHISTMSFANRDVDVVKGSLLTIHVSFVHWRTGTHTPGAPHSKFLVSAFYIMDRFSRWLFGCFKQIENCCFI